MVYNERNHIVDVMNIVVAIASYRDAMIEICGQHNYLLEMQIDPTQCQANNVNSLCAEIY